MSSILIIIAAILAVAGLAYLIVNKLPSKLKPVVSIVLWVVIIYLGYNIYQSIMKPIHFNQKKKVKYAYWVYLKSKDSFIKCFLNYWFYCGIGLLVIKST